MSNICTFVSIFMQYHIPCLIKGWLWSYGWIYNYLCNRCISPLILQIQIQLRRGVLDTTCDKVCQSLAAGLWVFPLLWFPPQCNWNIVESGLKHWNFEWGKFCLIYLLCLHIFLLTMKCINIDRLLIWLMKIHHSCTHCVEEVHVPLWEFYVMA